MLPVNFSPQAANGYGTGNSTSSINGASRTPSFSTAASSKLRRLRGTSNATMPTHQSLALPQGLYSPTAASLAPASTNGVNGVNSSSAVSRFQEGLIDAVVRRIRQSLPFFSGRELVHVEADEPIRHAIETLVELSRTHAAVVVRQLVEILLNLDKQCTGGAAAGTTHLDRKLYIQILQSQLLVLKILDVCLCFSWHTYRSHVLGLHVGPGGSALSVGSSNQTPYAQGNHASTIAHDDNTPWVDPPPLDANLATVTVSLLSGVLRRCMAEGGSELTFHDFEAVEAAAILTPADSPTGSVMSMNQKAKSADGGSVSSGDAPSRHQQDPYSVMSKPFGLRPTFKSLLDNPISLHTVLAKFAGRLMFSLSASNWDAVYADFRARLRNLASHHDESDITDIRAVSMSALDRKKLAQILSDIGGVMPQMKREKRVALASTITNAVTNWIDTRPQEYRECSESPRLLMGTPEKIFDEYYRMLDEQNRQYLWPTLSALLAISPERIRQAERAGGGGFTGLFSRVTAKKPSHFLDNLSRGLQQGKTVDSSMSAIHALCRAAIHIPPLSGNIAIRQLAPDLAEAVRLRLVLPAAGLKPFYESQEHINLDVISNAMVTVYRYDARLTLETVFLPCLLPARSDGVKCCVVRALLTLTMEASRLQHQAPLSTMYSAIAPVLRELFSNLACRKREVHPDGRITFGTSVPRVKTADRLTSDRDMLMLAVLALWRQDLGFFFANMTLEQTRAFNLDAGQLLLRPEAILIRSSAARTFGGMFTFALSYTPSDQCYEGGQLYLTDGLPVTIEFGSELFMGSRDAPDSQMLAVAIISSALTKYGNPEVDDAGGWKECRARMPGFGASEIALLIALTSSNQQQTSLAALCLKCLAVAEMQVEDNISLRPAHVTADELQARWHAFMNLTDQTSSMLGRVAQQKRYRKLLQTMSFVNGVNVMVWQECYRAWSALTPLVTATRDSPPSIPDDANRSPEQIQHEWQNLTFFLASFCGCCDTDLSHDTLALPLLPTEFLEKRRKNMHPPRELLEQFITIVHELLVSENRFVRDTAREALCNELHPSALAVLCPILQANIERVLSSMEWQPSRIIYVDQALQVLISIFIYVINAHVGVALEGATLVNLLSTFLHKGDGSETSFRIRCHFARLAEATWLRRQELAPLRQEVMLSADLLDKVFDWVSAAQSAVMIATGETRSFYLDCQLQFLRTVVAVMDGLDLSLPSQKRPGHPGAMMLFHKYSGILLSCIGAADMMTHGPLTMNETMTGIATTEAGSVKHLVVKGLFNMLSSTTEISPVNALSLSFSNEITKRIICAEVFSKLLRQGTRLDVEPAPEVLPPRLALCEHVKNATPLLALAACVTVPESDAEGFIGAIMRVCYTRKASMALLKSIVDLELATKSVFDQFRTNPTQIRLLSLFAKLQSEEYLRGLLIPVVQRMASVPTAQYETDPRRLGNYHLDDNLTNLEVITQTFLDSLYQSVENIPAVVKEICAHIYLSPSDNASEMRLIPVISFFFLRVVSPGLAQPESVGVDLPHDIPSIRRGLVLVARQIQQLANATPRQLTNPSEGESPNITAMARFCRSLVEDVPADCGNPEDVLSIPFEESDGMVLHAVLYTQSEKLADTLPKLPSINPSDNVDLRKEVWDATASKLQELGKPAGSLFQRINTREHTGYRDFVQRFSHRNMDAVKDIFVKLLGPKGGKPAVFALFLPKLNVDIHDVELLMAHTFKALSNINLHKCPLDIIVDFSGYNSDMEIPLLFWMTFLRLLPGDLLDRLNCLYLVNCNVAAQRYARRLYYMAGGLESNASVVAVASFDELERHLPELDSRSISATAAMDLEPRQVFDDIIFQQIPEPPLRATFELRTTHLRIITKRPQQIWPGLWCKATEMLTLDDIGQMFSMSSSGEDEFVLRPPRGRSSFIRTPKIARLITEIRAAATKAKSFLPAMPSSAARFEATTGTLIVVALIGLTHRNDELRLAILNLLHDIATFLGLRDLPLVPPKGSFVPFNPFSIAYDFSRRLAASFPELTLDVLQAYCTSLNSLGSQPRPVATQLIPGPWIRNLNGFIDPGSTHFCPDGENLRKTLRLLLEATAQHEDNYGPLQKYVWMEISKQDGAIAELAVEECIAFATSAGVGTRCIVIGDTLVSLVSVSTRGKVIAHLRKALSRTAALGSKLLSEEHAWHQLAALTRLTLVVCHHGRFPFQIQMFVPELIHAIVLLACHGPILLRKTLHDLAVNMVGALHLARADDPEAARALIRIQEELLAPDFLSMFGLQHSTWGDGLEIVPISAQDHIESVNELTGLFNRVIDHSAASPASANVWRARWMSLITSSAMHLWPALQSRSFLIFSALAPEFDEAFVTHILDFLRSLLLSPERQNKPETAMVLHALGSLVPKLPQNSAYLPQLFWVAVGLIASTCHIVYADAARLMKVVVEELHQRGAFDGGMANGLLEAREPVQSAVQEIEDLLFVSFDSSFSFALATIVFRGTRYPALRDSAEAVLRTLLQVNVQSMRHMRPSTDNAIRPLDEGSLAFVLALIPFSTTAQSMVQLLHDADATSGWIELTEARTSRDAGAHPILPLDMLGITDLRTAVLHSSLLISMLPNAAGDTAERDVILRVLCDTSAVYPQVVAIACKHALNSHGGGLDDSVTSIFASGSSQTMSSALTLLRLSVLEVSSIPPSKFSSIGTTYGSATVESLGDSFVSLQSNTEMATLLETYSMDGMLHFREQWMSEDVSFYQKVLPLVADMLTVMLNG